MYCPDCGRDNRDSAKFCIACGCSIGSQAAGLVATAVSLRPGTVLQTRYEVKKILKSGGMGSVYLAADQRLGIQCALKEMHDTYQDFQERQEAEGRFEREARVLASLRHPCLPVARDHFKEKGQFYLVMDYVEGEDLETLLKREAPKGFSEDQVRKIACEILEVLDYLHGQNPPIVYRDLKPSNIMIKEQDGAVFLIDFGIARAVRSGGTKKTAIGTEGYAPKEQYLGNPEPRSDLYALGATLHHLLTGIEPVVPFHFDPVGVLKSSISAEMEAVISKALEMNPEDRFPSAKKMKAALLRKKAPPARQRAKPSPSAPTSTVQPQPVTSPAAILSLHEAARYGEIQSIFDILTRYTDTQINARDDWGRTPLHWAAFGRHEHIVELLIQAGAMADVHDKSGLKPVHMTEHQGIISVLSRAEVESFSRRSSPFQEFEFNVVTLDDRGAATDKRRCKARYFLEDLGQGISLEMVAIPGGSFLMGSPETEYGRFGYEGPQNTVTVRPFFMGKFEVTQVQWGAVARMPQVSRSLGTDPSSFKGSDLPVESVSWNDVMEFCDRLSRKTGRPYRLPSEAEWEYACRAGTTTPFHFGPTITPDLVNHDGNCSYGNTPKGRCRGQTTPVGSFQVANAFGLHDMHGNVHEWCADPWHNNYHGAFSDGRVWDTGGDDSFRMCRGGSSVSSAEWCRAAFRMRGQEKRKSYTNVGFRVVLSPA